ncbi:hypothetical protein B0H66DRAFT_602918 [Apodospora peruviana]|uniref:Rhodopsin domain-containing protein n=1 Tax=Apodospora peruviana TaxID=516989 RepID=A0AAE0I497_9PEZI|nr:hypothetical protein B0H66DRAFT_602918 [Apodospora peruviana]
MPLYSDPPPLRSFSNDKPTLLVCWWITIFCTVIILLRVTGRFVRTERLFTEDRVAALALIPLFMRMGCVHFILLYGTNNAQLADADLSDEDLHRKSIASGLVLLSRILYAATLWILKNAILEFFRRLNVSWERSYEVTLLLIRCTLLATFIAVVISDLAECRPFSHYWQVLPDPGGQCRQGYAQLLTMAVCNVLTDLLLVFFPIPLIIRSQMTTKRKVQLVLLFSLSLGVVGVTIYRVPHIIEDNGSQQSRSLYASVELLFATAASNALVLGSFVRDRGVKKNKFKYDSVAAGSMERSSGSGSRRPTMNRHWGSDEDLVRDVGFGVKPDLRENPTSPMTSGFYTPAPLAKFHDDMNQWQFPKHGQRDSAIKSDDYLMPGDQVPSPGHNMAFTPRRVSFFDYGGLLDDHDGSTRRGSNLSNGPTAVNNVPAPSIPASASGLRRGSQALLQDLGGFLSPLSPLGQRPVRPKAKSATELQPLQQTAPNEAEPPPPARSAAAVAPKEPVLMDLGGLLYDPNDKRDDAIT